MLSVFILKLKMIGFVNILGYSILFLFVQLYLSVKNLPVV